jgi:hypothetical protein
VVVLAVMVPIHVDGRPQPQLLAPPRATRSLMACRFCSSEANTPMWAAQACTAPGQGDSTSKSGTPAAGVPETWDMYRRMIPASTALRFFSARLSNQPSHLSPRAARVSALVLGFRAQGSAPEGWKAGGPPARAVRARGRPAALLVAHLPVEVEVVHRRWLPWHPRPDLFDPLPAPPPPAVNGWNGLFPHRARVKTPAVRADVRVGRMRTRSFPAAFPAAPRRR